MSYEEPTHRDRALDAIKAAEDGAPEQSESAQVYATVAVAQATLAVHDILIEVRNELERLNNLTSPPP